MDIHKSICKTIHTLQIAAGSAAPIAPKSVKTNRGARLVASASGAYVGDANVTTATGFPIPTAWVLIVPIEDLNNIYVVGAGTVYVIYET